MEEATGTPLLEQTTQQLEDSFFRYITHDNSIYKLYKELGIKYRDNEHLSEIVDFDLYTILGVLEEKEQVDLFSIKKLIHGRSLKIFDNIPEILNVNLNKWYEIAKDLDLKEGVDSLITSYFDFKELRRLSENYKKSINMLQERQKTDSPKYMKTIQCEEGPLAIGFNSNGELIVFGHIQGHDGGVLRSYDINTKTLNWSTETGHTPSFRGTPGIDAFYGGLHVDEDDVVFAFSSKTVQRIEPRIKGKEYEKSIILKRKNYIDLSQHPRFKRGGIVGMTSQNGNHYILLYEPYELGLIHSSGDEILSTKDLSKYMRCLKGTEDECPRIKRYGENLFISAGRGIFAYTPDLGKVKEIEFQGLNKENPFAPTKFDFDRYGDIWVMDKWEQEELPSLKAYSLQDKETFFSTTYETFLPLKHIDFKSKLRDLAIDRQRNILAVTNFFRNEIDIYIIAKLLDAPK